MGRVIHVTDKDQSPVVGRGPYVLVYSTFINGIRDLCVDRFDSAMSLCHKVNEMSAGGLDPLHIHVCGKLEAEFETIPEHKAVQDGLRRIDA